MPDRNILSEIGPKVEALVLDLIEQGAEKHAVLYVIEKEVARLREHPLQRPRGEIDEPSNDWPSAEDGAR